VLLDPAAGLVASLVVEVDGNIVGVGIVRGGLHDEVADAAADLQGQRIGVAEDGCPVDGRRKLPGVEEKGRFDLDHALHSGFPGG
jgi:hypothetical protein